MKEAELKAVHDVLKEYEDRPVVEFGGSPRELVSELVSKAGLSFISGAVLSRSGQTIYVTVDGRTPPGKLQNVMNTQFRV